MRVVAILLTGLTTVACDAPTGPAVARVEQMQVSASLSVDVISHSAANDSVVVWIKVRNPLPLAVTLGTPAEYPWWRVSVDAAGSMLEGVALFVNSGGPLRLEAGAEMVRGVVVRVREGGAVLPPGEYVVRGGLEYVVGAPQRLIVQP